MFSSEVLLHFEVSALGMLGGGIISKSSGVEHRGSVWYGVSESALPDCRPLVDAIPVTEQVSPQCRGQKCDSVEEYSMPSKCGQPMPCSS